MADAPKRQEVRGSNNSLNQIDVTIHSELQLRNGVTATEARSIADDAAARAVERFSSNAIATALERIAEFNEKLVTRLEALGELSVLEDPAMQMTYQKAAVVAGSTGRSEDYETLVELLVNRVKDQRRAARAAIERATEIVDRVDDVALVFLTQWWIMANFVPGGDTLNEIFRGYERILWRLPTAYTWDRGWLDHLDSLDCIRRRSASQPEHQFIRRIAAARPEMVSVGMTGSEATKVRSCAERLQVAPPGIVRHDLKPRRFRFCFPQDFERFEQRAWRALYAESKHTLRPLDSEIAGTLREMRKWIQVDERLISIAARRIKWVRDLSYFPEHMDDVMGNYSITLVGAVLAKIQATRYVPELSEIDFEAWLEFTAADITRIEPKPEHEPDQVP